MGHLSNISGVQAVLLATQLSADNNLESLRYLQAHHRDTLRGTLVLRILLTFLPESIEPRSYVPYLKDFASASSSAISELHLDISSVKELPEAIARQKVRKLHLLPLKHPPSGSKAPLASDSDPLTSFLIHRAYRIDAETGLIPLVVQLIEPFIEHSQALRTWLMSTLLPLLRLNYEYYPDHETVRSLEAFQALGVGQGVDTLLPPQQQAAERQIGRDLRGLVGPWVYGKNRLKRRKVRDKPQMEEEVQLVESPNKTPTWTDINQWIVQTSKTDFNLSVKVFDEWKGPGDVDLGGYEDEADTIALMSHDDEESTQYASTALKCILSTTEESNSGINGSYRLLLKAAELSDLRRPPDLPDVNQTLPKLRFGTVAREIRVYEEDFAIDPTPDMIEYLYGVVISCTILRHLGYPMPCQDVVRLPFNSDAQVLDSKRLLENLSKNSGKGRNWSRIRHQLLWLRDWEFNSEELVQEPRLGYGVFGLIPKNDLEKDILKAMLVAGEYQVAVDIFVDGPSTGFTFGEVEAVVEESILNAYDNASNGNRTRGGIKRANDMLKAFFPKFPDSVKFRQIEALIAATHALSFYSLTLQHGIPFKPVTIRVHQDPVGLIEKVLSQNSRSYTKLDDLLSIGRSLVNAGLPSTAESGLGLENTTSTSEQTLLNVERRVTSLAISAALNENDFGTAYSYITTRLSPQQHPIPSSDSNDHAITDDISWRAAYNAGRYRPPVTAISNPTEQLQILTQRLELLSLALILAPNSALTEILAAWRRCDEEMNTLRAREAEEDSAWDDSGDKKASVRNATTTVPGAFSAGDSPVLSSKGRPPGKGGYNEEAPMGLFDVARGAARAFGKTAFPLRGGNTTIGTSEAQPQYPTEGGKSQEGERDVSDEGRVRKRDMVSNMATGALASGIGWVLGAQPVNQPR